MLLLIDTRDRPPEPEPSHPGGWDLLATLLSWLFPWPAIIAWLFVGTVVLPGLPGACFAAATLVVCFWRLSKLYPDWGLRDWSQ